VTTPKASATASEVCTVDRTLCKKAAVPRRPPRRFAMHFRSNGKVQSHCFQIVELQLKVRKAPNLKSGIEIALTKRMQSTPAVALS
jgi:hypothetical protein